MKILNTLEAELQNKIAKVQCSRCLNILEVIPEDLLIDQRTEAKFIRCPVCKKKHIMYDRYFYDRSKLVPIFGKYC